MMKSEKILENVASRIEEVIDSQTDLGKHLWEELLLLHPADIAQLINNLEYQNNLRLFLKFDGTLRADIFYELQTTLMLKIFQNLSEADKEDVLKNSQADDITDFFNLLSDDELKSCLEILHKKDRQRVLSLMQFAPDSAGGIMEVDVLTLMQNYTVNQSIAILQRLKPIHHLHHTVYVTDEQNKLVGFIKLEDLVLKGPEVRLISIIRPVAFIAQADQDQEEVAQTMAHYGAMIVPVVNEQQYLLGVIPGATLVDVIQQEAQEDAQKMSGSFLSKSYFDTSFASLVWRRGIILAVLLLVESLTSLIIGRFEATLTTFLFSFIAMLVSAGGNTSSQTSAIVIQGMSSGEINDSNINKFLRREFLIGFVLSFCLSIVAFVRVYAMHQEFWGSVVVSLSLGAVVLLSVLFGSIFPIALKRMNIDPAFSAGPFLATLMDILGILVYCYIAYLILY